MRRNDVYIFDNHAWLVVDSQASTTTLRRIAGPDTETRGQVVPRTMLAGRPLYRMVNAIDDVDLDDAKDEAAGELDVRDLGSDPRRWADTFCRIHGTRVTPDPTIMLGWFANAIDAAVQKEVLRVAALAKRRQRLQKAKRAAARTFKRKKTNS